MREAAITRSVVPASLPTDQRGARKRRNRESLISAAVELFGKNGFEATTIDQIAAHAGLSPRTFFYHFATKDDILFDGYAERLGEAIRCLRAATGRPLSAALADAATAVAIAIADQREVFLLRHRMYRDVPSLVARMLAINEQWIDGMTTAVAVRLGVNPVTDVRPRLAAAMLNAANRVAIENWIGHDGTGDLHTYFAETMDHIRPAINRIDRTIRQTARASAGPKRARHAS